LFIAKAVQFGLGRFGGLESSVQLPADFRGGDAGEI
jgi:hypothetical protein